MGRRCCLRNRRAGQVAARFDINLTTLPTRQVSRRRLVAGAAASFAFAAIAVGGAFGPPSRLFSDYTTGVGERRRVVLADGSAVWLNSSTALSVRLSDLERRLILHAGEALFEVAKEGRPFIVRAGAGEAYAVGTVYSVQRRGQISDVVVTEGTVEIHNGSAVMRLMAGQRVAYGDQFESEIFAVDGEALTAWSRGKLIFNRRPLAEVARELERYQPGIVIIRDKRLERLEVTGVFDLDDPTAMLRAISATIKTPIRHLPFITVIG